MFSKTLVHVHRNNDNYDYSPNSISELPAPRSHYSQKQLMNYPVSLGDRMHVILNGEQLEEVDCFKYLGSQVAADGGCKRDVVHRMNEGY